MLNLDYQNAKLHTLPDAPTLRTANHEQLCQHSDRLKVLNADVALKRFGARDDEDGFFERATYEILEQEDYWRQCNLVWAWIDERPVWASPVDWCFEILPDPERPTRRRFRFSLLGGGQLAVVEQFKFRRWSLDSKEEIHCSQQRLHVTTDVGSGLQRFTGIIKHVCCEMQAMAVLFPTGTPLTVAERTAATFRLLTHANSVGTENRPPDPENFVALLDRSERCCVCRRPLRDHVSTLLGIGPDCAKQWNLPHNLEAANRILQRRKELLGEGAALAGVS
jgi:Family of unknown function (DUF6011)